jgi:hypothetical protein
LSAAARQLIADARGADEPSAEDEARVKARWLAGIAAGAGVSSLSEAVRAAASTGWGLKVGALVAALAAASAGVLLGWPQTSGHPTGHELESAPAAHGPAAAPQAVAPQAVAPQAVAPEPVAPQPVVPQPVIAEPAPAQPVLPVPPQAGAVQPSAPEVAKPVAEAAAPAEAPVQQPELAAAPPREVKARAATSPHRAEHAEKLQEKPATPAAEEPAAPAALALSGQLGEEIAALSEIRSNLQAGAATRALEQLSAYRRRFGQPSLAMEADALRVDALCRAGQRDSARAAAAAFASDWPNSPLQQRVSAACP